MTGGGGARRRATLHKERLRRVPMIPERLHIVVGVAADAGDLRRTRGRVALVGERVELIERCDGCEHVAVAGESRWARGRAALAVAAPSPMSKVWWRGRRRRRRWRRRWRRPRRRWRRRDWWRRRWRRRDWWRRRRPLRWRRRRRLTARDGQGGASMGGSPMVAVIHRHKD